jgi:succinate dehydrogenase / fumarate reductase cytochrome b subunit
VPASALDPRAALTARARRLFSLSGLVPLGAFLLVHLVADARLVAGDAAFARAADRLRAIPALPLIELVVVLAPLGVHGLVGLWLVAARTPLVEPSPYAPGVRAAMRATGALLAVFLALHLTELRFRAGVVHTGGGELATLVQAGLSSMHGGVPWRAVAYLVGTGCATFHFVAGVWGWFARTARGRASRAARRLAASGAAIAGVVMWAVFANVVVYAATGARLFGSAPVEIDSPPCPATDGGR